MLLIVKMAHHDGHKSGRLINVLPYYAVNKENRTFARVGTCLSTSMFHVMLTLLAWSLGSGECQIFNERSCRMKDGSIKSTGGIIDD